MKQLKWVVPAFFIIGSFLGEAQAMDFGGSGAAASQESSAPAGDQVEVVNQPVQIIKKKIDGEEKEIPYMRVLAADYFIQEIDKDISLGNGETYESEPMDVREYKEISFYVVPDQVLGGQADTVYQLDAFFSVTADTQKVQKMGEKPGDSLNGWQEFGNMLVDENSKELRSSFYKLTTGETTSRVLSTKVYGPFVHVVLKNLSPDAKCRFKIVAYLTR